VREISQSRDYWKLCTHLSVMQATLIICGSDPEQLQWEVENQPQIRPPGYTAAITALKHGIECGELKSARLVYDDDGRGNETDSINVHGTQLALDEIDRFLRGRGRICEFFEGSQACDPTSGANSAKLPFKLAAALKAWSAVTSDSARLRGKSPKQALKAWLIENAADLGLTNRRGEPNGTGIDEICKVANWKPRGGATPTPASSPVTAAPPLIRLPSVGPPQARESFAADLDDEIPF
jgi:hypothetical protein